MSLSELSYLLRRIHGDLALALEALARMEGPQTVTDLRAKHPLWEFLDPTFKTLGGWERSGMIAKLSADKNPYGTEYVLSQSGSPVYDFDEMLTATEFNLGIHPSMTSAAPADE